MRQCIDKLTIFGPKVNLNQRKVLNIVELSESTAYLNVYKLAFPIHDTLNNVTVFRSIITDRIVLYNVPSF